MSSRAAPVGSEEFVAREKLVIYDIEGLAFSAGVEPREDDRIGSIVNDRQGQKMGSAHLDEDAKRVDADATTQISLARTENRSRPEDDIAKTVSISVFFY